jgi:hypothetical protein
MKTTKLLCVLLLTLSQFQVNAQFEKYYNQVINSPNLETEILGGRVHLTHLYKQQIKTLYEGRNLDRNAFIEKYVNEVYSPYTSFWGAFFDKSGFIDWLNENWDILHNPNNQRIQFPFCTNIDSLYLSTAKKIKSLTQREPKGIWVLCYGTGGDMGGLWNNIMFVNFLNFDEDDEFIINLPHELNHQIYDEYNHEPDNLSRRFINEGLACYLNYLFWDKKYSPAKNIGFTEEEWDYSVKNEARIFDYAKDKLQSTDEDVIDKFGKWHCYIWENSPDRLAYFVGFRIIQAYIEKHGKDSWKEIYDLPLSEVIAKSDYVKFIEFGIPTK